MKKMSLYAALCMSVFMFTACSTPTPSQQPPAIRPTTEAESKALDEKEKPKAIEKLKIASAWSTKDDSASAVDELIAKLEEKKITKPSLMVLYSTGGEIDKTGYDPEVIVKKINEKYQGVNLFGASSSTYVATEEGIHKGEKGLVALLAMESPELSTGTALFEFTAKPDKNEVIKLTKEGCELAAKKAGKTITDKPEMIYLSSVLYDEYVLEALHEVYGKDVMIFGGTNGFTKDKTEKYAFANDKVSKNGCSLAFVYSGAKSGGAFAAGFMGTNKSGKITSAEYRKILTIDNRPALDVFDEWTGSVYRENAKKVSDDEYEIWGGSAPKSLLGKEIMVNGKKDYSYARAYKFNTKEKSISLLANLEVGDQVCYIPGAIETITARTPNLIKQATIDAGLTVNSIKGSIFNLCQGARGAISTDEENKKVIDDVIKGTSGKPFIGYYSSGEQGTFRGYGAIHGNYMSSIVEFGEK